MFSRSLRFLARASLFISGIVIGISCKKQFSTPGIAEDAAELNAVHANAAFLNNSSVGTFQVITIPNAFFYGTAAVVTDVAGNIFIADSASHIIRKINTVGVSSVFAGTLNSAGFTNGQGAAARFNKPIGLAIDAGGNLYVADKSNHAIRKITRDSIVTTLAGTGSSGTTEGPGANAKFNLPSGVAVDAAGNVYVADAGNNKIRKIRSDTVSTFAGNGTVGLTDDVNGLAQFNNPTGVAVNSAGTTVYVADAGNNKIRIIAGGETNSLAGGGVTGDTPGFSEGTGSAALFNKPMGITIDAGQNIYVADKNNNRIRQLTPAGSVTTLAGTGAADYLDGIPSIARFNGPTSVFVNAFGNIFVADAANIRVREIGVIAMVSTFRLVNRLYQPTGIAIDPSGNIYVSDYFCAIHKITPDGNETVFAGNEENLTGFQDGPGPVARFSYPSNLASDAAGNIYVCDALNNAIRKITPSGMVSTINPNRGWVWNGQVTDGPLSVATFGFPYGLAVDPAGNIFVMDGTTRVRKISTDGIVTTIAGSGTSGFADGQGTAAQFNQAVGIAVDANDNVFVADYFNNRIRKVSPTGLVTTIAGGDTHGYADGPVSSALFNSPYGITVASDGNLFVCDRNNNRIRKISPSGIVTTIAGSGDGNFGGYAEGLAPYARFGWPLAMVINNSGAIFVADNFNRRIRKIQ